MNDKERLDLLDELCNDVAGAVMKGEKFSLLDVMLVLSQKKEENVRDILDRLEYEE